MHLETCLAVVREATSVPELHSALQCFTEVIGLQYGSVVGSFVDPATGKAGALSVAILPPDYESVYLDIRTPCPIIEKSYESTTPFCWDRDTYVTAGQIPKWELQAEFGMAQGVAMAVPLRNRRRLILGFDGPAAARSNRVRQFQERALHSLALNVVQSAADLLLPVGVAGYVKALTPMRDAASAHVLIHAGSCLPRPPVVTLTPREVACLSLAWDGKTVSDIAADLGISSNVARKYIGGARDKLGCTKTLLAARLAKDLSLI